MAADRGADGGEGVEKGLEGVAVDVCHGSGDDVLDFWEHLVEHCLGVGRDVNEDAAAVVGVGDALGGSPFDCQIGLPRAPAVQLVPKVGHSDWSEIVPGVGEIEALVGQGEVGDDCVR